MSRGIFGLILISLLFLPSRALAGVRIPIGEVEIIDRVITAAPSSRIAREELGQVEADLLGSKAVFDTALGVEANYTRDEFKRSSDFFGTREDIANWNVELAKKFPFGTTASLEWTNQRLRLFNVPSIGGAEVFPTDPTYESIVRFSVSQPLLKNFVGMNDRGTVAQAKKALRSADLGTRFQIATVAHRALSLYWQWVLSYAHMRSWATSVTDANNFLYITWERQRLGTAEETDVLAAQANLISRKNGLLKAKRLAEGLERDLKIVLGYSADDYFSPRDRYPRHIYSSYSDSEEGELVATALENRWDYLAQKEEVERLDIGLVTAKNRRWPELDLIGTLAFNELTTSYSDTIKDIDSPQWAVGMQLSFPLENRAAVAEHKKTRHEKSKAVIELKRMENEIANSIAELVRRLKINTKMLSNAKSQEVLQKRKLQQEIGKYRVGRSSSEIIIRYQDDRLQSSLAALNAWADYLQTVLDLRLAGNTLVDL